MMRSIAGAGTLPAKPTSANSAVIWSRTPIPRLMRGLPFRLGNHAEIADTFTRPGSAHGCICRLPFLPDQK